MISLPEPHDTCLKRLLERMWTDPRIEAVLGAGSLALGGFDRYSDIDLVICVTPAAYDVVMETRLAFAEGLGDFISGFTGEHVGEPRLLICLYGPPLLHVDLKFVRLSDLTSLVERPLILWARDPAAVEAQLDGADIRWPNMPPQWFEDRVWAWLHYGAVKVQRGELFEALSMLSFLQDKVLGPMLMRRAGRDQRGVRRIETLLDVAEIKALRELNAGHDAGDIRKALKAAMALYLDLRGDDPPSRLVPQMPDVLLPFLADG